MKRYKQVIKKKRDYRKEYDNYQSRPEQKKNRAIRNNARRNSTCVKGDGMEVDHIIPLSKNGDNSKENQQVVTRAINRQKYNKVENMERYKRQFNETIEYDFYREMAETISRNTTANKKATETWLRKWYSKKMDAINMMGKYASSNKWTDITDAIVDNIKLK